ncbi:MAG: hypothetical protein II664_01505 [Oscillospiraceae bacterium]|nr:hypothetical protein [Oscillospiraceae bacterium]
MSDTVDSAYALRGTENDNSDTTIPDVPMPFMPRRRCSGEKFVVYADPKKLRVTLKRAARSCFERGGCD